jgi:hypothetical protein
MEGTMDGKISNFAQVASLRRYVYTEGKEKNLEVIDCDNGNIRFLLNVSKALDVMQLYHRGQNMSFVSKNGFTARENGFLSRFEGGMVYTCGFDSLGHREGFELHGTHHNDPAKILRAECDENGIVVEAIVESTQLFGKNLEFRRRISSPIGGETLTIEDTLTNKGFRDEDYCILYHVNVGYPMLDDGGEIVADVKACETRTEWARINEDGKFRITDSIPNNEETCYFLKLNKPEISLVNKKLGKTFTVSYSEDTLPCFIEWHSMASGDYALGFEPASTNLDNSFSYSKLGAGKKVDFKVELTVKEA